MSTVVDISAAPDSGATVNGSAPVTAGHAHGPDREQNQDQRLADLAEIIQSYNAVTEKLQRSHEVLQDEVLRLQEELAGKNAQLQRSKRLAALGEMAAGIAHEIRNPLAAIHLYARMLVEDLGEWEAGRLPETVTPQRETSEKIADAVRGLNAIVTDVLSFSREIKPRFTVIDAEHLFARVIDAHRPSLEAANINVAIQVDACELHGDPQLLHQALLNLVRNGVDAMSSGESVQRELVLSARADGDTGTTVIAVGDSGPGIQQDDVDRIFNPFFTTRNTGTGLGLAIVHRIVDAHSGGIRVINDGGAVFELRLPRSIDSSEASGSLLNHEATSGSAENVCDISDPLRRTA